MSKRWVVGTIISSLLFVAVVIVNDLSITSWKWWVTMGDLMAISLNVAWMLRD